MTNREWLLKSKQTIDGSYNFCQTLGVICTPLYGKPLCCECTVFKNWLNAERITLADDDLIELGFIHSKITKNYITYEDDYGKRFTLYKDGEKTFGGDSLSGTLIDKLKQIGNKKRKELGW